MLNSWCLFNSHCNLKIFPPTSLHLLFVITWEGILGLFVNQATINNWFKFLDVGKKCKSKGIIVPSKLSWSTINPSYKGSHEIWESTLSFQRNNICCGACVRWLHFRIAIIIYGLCSSGSWGRLMVLSVNQAVTTRNISPLSKYAVSKYDMFGFPMYNLIYLLSCLSLCLSLSILSWNTKQSLLGALVVSTLSINIYPYKLCVTRPQKWLLFGRPLIGHELFQAVTQGLHSEMSSFTKSEIGEKLPAHLQEKI